MAETIPQSVAKRVVLKAYLASDHVSPATGKTIAVVISKNAAAFGNPSAGATNATAIANGWYYVDLSTTDTNTAGPLIVRGTEGTIDDTEVAYTVGKVPATLAATDVTGNLPANLIDWNTTGTLPTFGATVDAVLTSAGLDNVVTETGVNARQALAVILDALVAKLSGVPAIGASGTIVIRDVNDAYNRVTAGVDGTGNRTSLTLNPPT